MTLVRRRTPGRPPTSTDPRAEAVDGVERPGQHQPLGDRARDLRAVPEVGERVVGPGGDDALDLAGVDPLDLGQRQPDAPRPAVGPAALGRVGPRGLAEHDRRRLVERRHPLHDVLLLGGVDVEPEDRDAALAGVLEDQPLGVHAGVVGEDAGQEVGRPVGLEPGRLVGRQRERRGVGLAEAERRERLDHLPDRLDHGQGVPAAEGGREEPELGLGHPLDVAERPPLLVGLGVGDPAELGDHLDHLLVEDHHAVGLRAGSGAGRRGGTSPSDQPCLASR